MMHILRIADPHNTTFIAGVGSDADTLGTNRIFVYDSTLFDFHQAELCLHSVTVKLAQNTPNIITKSRTFYLSAGKLHKTGCPTPEVTRMHVMLYP